MATFIHSFGSNIAKVGYNKPTTIPVDYKLGYTLPGIASFAAVFKVKIFIFYVSIM